MSKRTKEDRAYDSQLVRYTAGFGGALAIVYLIYFAVTQEWFSGAGLGVWLLTCASLLLFVQLWVFLHVTDEQKPRWNVVSLIYTIAMLLVLVGGSIWIMANMNYNMHMTPEQMKEYMIEQNKKGF